MDRLIDIRQTYHVSIRRERKKPHLEKIRKHTIDPQYLVQGIVNQIPQLVKSNNNEKILGALKQMQTLSSETLNNPIILQFLVQTYLQTERLSNSNMIMRKIHGISRQVLQNFTSCDDATVISKLDILQPLLVTPSAIMIYNNIICISEWSMEIKSSILISLCRCLGISYKQPIHLEYLEYILIDEVPISQQAFVSALDLLNSYLFFRQQKEQEEECISIVANCTNILLKCYSTLIPQNFHHPILEKIDHLLENYSFFSFENQVQKALIEIIKILITLKINFSNTNRICQIIYKALNSNQHESVLVAISIVREMFLQEKLVYLIERNIIENLVNIVMIHMKRWNIKMQVTLTIIWMLQRIDSSKQIKRMEDKGCFNILKQGLLRGETEVAIKSLRCVETMLSRLEKIDSFFQTYNIAELVNRLINHKNKEIATEAQRVLSILEGRVIKYQ